MNILFRVDSGSHIGIGHLVRCLTIAEKISQRGFSVCFVTKDHYGSRLDLIPKKYKTIVLPGGVSQLQSESLGNDYSKWLGGDRANDLQLTNDVISKENFSDVVVLDHYALDYKYEVGLETKKIVVIDDLKNRPHYCDLLIDQTVLRTVKDYLPLMKKKDGEVLAGSDFALIKNSFLDEKKKISQAKFLRPIKKILVFFGGADSHGNTLKFLLSLKESQLKNYEFMILLYEKHPDYHKVQKISEQFSNIKLLSFIPDFAPIMAATDLFIGAVGTTTWERACLGVASALISVAQNQIEICTKLQGMGTIHYMGSDNEVKGSEWDQLFESQIHDDSYWAALRQKGFDLIDGCGLDRAVAKIEGLINA